MQCELLPKIFLHFSEERGFHVVRVALRGGEEHMPFLKVHLLPVNSEQLIFAAADLVIDNEETAERGMRGVAWCRF
jgi:hypothetical protein